MRARTKTSKSCVRERSDTLFSSLSPCPRHLLIWINNKQFRVLCPGFYVFSGKQSCYDHRKAVYPWHTWWRRHLDDFEWVGSTRRTFFKSRSRVDDFFTKFRCQPAVDNEFPPVLHPRTTMHTGCDQAIKLVFVLVLGSKAF